MKDHLLDIIQHTHGLGVIELIKITGTDKETHISAISEDKSVIVTGVFKSPHPEFMGVFGMPNLNNLKTILGFDEYDEHAKINTTMVDKDGVQVPAAIHFESKAGDFINDYRLMAKAIVEEKVKNVKFNGVSWDVEFVPSVASVQKLRKQESANNEESHFVFRTEKNDLRIYFGAPSTHSGNFVFHSGVKGTLKEPLKWPVKVVRAILDLPGDKVFRVSDKGASEITVDSGLIDYRYLLPAQQK